jgi:hypothetical protein
VNQEAIMITTVDTSAGVGTLHRVLSEDFATAGWHLAQTRLQQRRKDTPAHRAAVVEACARIDAVLDMYLDLRRCDAERPA